MKKTILTLALFTSVALTTILFSAERAAAQMTVGATIGLGLPMGDFGDAAGVGFGFTAIGRYNVNDNLGVGVDIGFNTFGAKNNDGVSYSIVPIAAAADYAFGDGKLKPYIGAELGLAIVSAKVSIDPGFGLPVESASVSSTGFFLAPMVGIKYGITDNLNFIANLKYNYASESGGSLGWIGINAGITYGFGK